MKRGGESGFTLVEIVIALLIGAVAVAGLYQSFNMLHKWWIAAGVQSDQRQNARVGLEAVTRDLEMAGYQTTGYGDPHKIGLAITFASAREIEVDQQRPDSDTITSANPVYRPRLVYYHVATDMRTGRQHLYRQIRTQPGVPTPDELVAENVSRFSLAYFDEDGADVPGLPPVAPNGSAAYSPGVAVPANSPLRAIRRIRVTLGTTTARPLPFGPSGREFTMTASVVPQNLVSADEVTADATPPTTPGGMASYDTRSCLGKLRVRWDANSEPDLAGYRIFYGPTAHLDVPLLALGDRTSPQISLNTDLLLITKDADRAASPNTYALQIAAYDSAGNQSGLSASISGDPSPDVTAFGGANDTTVNPAKPAPPTGMTVAAGAAEGELVITWAAPSDGSATAGFRLYRSAAPFAGGHIDSAQQIAGEADLGASATTYTDRGLAGCSTYYYALASVNCDETLVAGYQHDAGNPAASDYATASGAPQDLTPPPAPSLAGSQPGVQQALVALENPLQSACPDFLETKVFWARDAVPPTDGSGAVLPDSDGGSPGTFTTRGSQVIAFDSESVETPLTPALAAGSTYNLLAISYDVCGNASTGAAAALTLPVAPECLDVAPGAFSNAAITSCQPDAVTLGWSYPDQATVTDHAGFRIERTGPGGTEPLTTGPTAAMTWTDGGPLQAGAEYTYAVTASDCSWELDLADPGFTLPVGYVAPPVLTLGPVLPGGLQRHVPVYGGSELDPANFVTTVSDLSAPYTHHNNVRLWIQNTSRSPVTIKRMSVAWENANVVLDSVVIGGAPADTAAQTVSAGGVASGVEFSVGARITDTAAGEGSPSGAVPLLLRFTLPDGGVSRLANMRSQTLVLSLRTWNESFQDTDCVRPAQVTVDVPRGPVLGGFSQSAPGAYGIDSYQVVGASGTARDTDVRVPYGISVNVFGTAFDNSRDLFADGVNRGFSALKLVGIAAPPADSAAVPAMPSTGTFFERPLQGLGGDRYAIYRATPTSGGALMPQVSDEVLWYCVLAVDNTGNWDRVPEPDHGNYAYFQPPFDPCTTTPRAPVLTLAATTPSQALLTWTAPTEYEDGVPIDAHDQLTYDVYVKSAGGEPWPSSPASAGQAELFFSHDADLLAGSYYYMVRARNSCAAGPRPSADSNVVMECEGSAGLDCSLFAVPSSANYGEPIALTVSDHCAFQDNGVADNVVFRVRADAATTDFTADETGDSGRFAKTITAVWTGGGGDQVLAASGSLSVDLVVDGATPCPARTVTITGGECYTTPNPPTSFTAIRGAEGSRAAVLTWVRPNYNTDGSPLADLAGYELAMARCATYNSGTGLCSIWSDWVSLPLNDPAAQAYTWTNLNLFERYKFRVRAKDRCLTPNLSAWTAESSIVRIR